MKKRQKWMLEAAGLAVLLAAAAALWFFRPVHPKVDWTEETPVRVWYQGEEITNPGQSERWKIAGLVEDLSCRRILGAYEETGEELFTVEIEGRDRIRLWFSEEGDRGRIRINDKEYSFRGATLAGTLSEYGENYRQEKEWIESVYQSIAEPMWEVFSSGQNFRAERESGEDCTAEFKEAWRRETDKSKESFLRLLSRNCWSFLMVEKEEVSWQTEGYLYRHNVYAFLKVRSVDGAVCEEFLVRSDVHLGFDANGEITEMAIGGTPCTLNLQCGDGGMGFTWELLEDGIFEGTISFTPIWTGSETSQPRFETQSIVYVTEPS